MVMTLTGMAATLDTIAEQPWVEVARAESLHQVISLKGSFLNTVINLSDIHPVTLVMARNWTRRTNQQCMIVNICL